MGFSTVIVVAAVIGWLFWKWWNSQTAKAGRIVANWSGPKALPVLGNFFDIPAGDLSALGKKLYEWGAKYESPLRLQMGPIHIVHIYEPNQMEAFLKQNKNLRKPREYEFAARSLGHGLITTSNIPVWSQRRKMLTNAFHFQILRDFNPIYQEHALALVEAIKQNQNKHPNKPIDVAPLINLAALDTICEAAMGTKLNALKNSNSAYVTALHRTAELESGRMWNPLLWWDKLYNFTPQWREEKQNIKVLWDFTNKIIQEREEEWKLEKAGKKKTEEVGKKKIMAFLDLLLELKEDGNFSLDDIREEVDTFMFAGHDTSGVALMWFTFILGVHTDIQQQLREEVEEIIGLDPNTVPQHEQLGKLPLLERCLKESQRLFPTVPVTARHIDEPVTLDEKHTIPPGITVWTNYFALHHNPKIWKDPTRYDPDRFLPENSVGRHPYAFIPFSAGQRNCIGQKFALTEIKIVMINLLRNFTWESAQKPSEMKQSVEFVNRPASGIWVRMTPIEQSEE